MAYIRIADLAKLNGLLTTAMACKECNLHRSNWNIMVGRGIIPMPTVVVSWSRWPLYTTEDITKIKELIQEYYAQQANRKDPGLMEREKLKMFSRVQAASILKVPHVTFEYWVRNGKVPRPSNQVGCFMCYDEDDIEYIRGWVAKHYRPPQKDYE
jgi:hypothetical protein